MTISAPQQTALEQASVSVAYFVEFHFAAGTLRVNTTNQIMTWGGYDWIGLGSLGTISSIEESEGMEPKSMTFTLNAAQSSILAIGVGAVENYRGLPVKMYFCPLNVDYTLLGTPEICWRGLMDTIGLGINGEEGSIALKCETSAYGLKRRQVLRLNAAQQKLNYPTDTGFDYQNSLIAQPALWLSKSFQAV